jgi:hypothetical protein
MAEGDLIPRRLKSLLEDWLTGNSTVSKIEGFFGEEDIAFTEGPASNAGTRRSLIRGFYRSLDSNSRRDQKRFLNVLAAVLEYLEEREAREPFNTSFPDDLAAFRKELGKLGYAYSEGKILATSVTARLDDAKMHAETFDLAHMGEHIRRIEGAIDTDPAAAIGSAKELVETTAKTILDQRGVAYGKNDDLPGQGGRNHQAHSFEFSFARSRLG